MSAIAGAVFADSREMSAGFLGQIVRSAVPRGFDGVSEWHSGPAGLIRFHHATTPEAVGEVQPLPGPSGAVIAFDGRLDNRADLLALLGDRGKALTGAPDVAIALALFEARGEAFLNALVGDWAIAIWPVLRLAEATGISTASCQNTVGRSASNVLLGVIV